MEAVSGHFGELFKGAEAHRAGGIPGHLGGQGIGLVAVVFRGLGQLLQGIGGGIQPHVLGNGTGVVVQAVHTGVQAVDAAAHGQHPAEPLDGVPLEHDHQHDACQHQHPQHHRQQLPQAEVHLAAPLGQHGLQGPRYVGVDHIHQGRKPLPVGHEHGGNGGKNTGHKISA